jgi:hypothetical protein
MVGHHGGGQYKQYVGGFLCVSQYVTKGSMVGQYKPFIPDIPCGLSTCTYTVSTCVCRMATTVTGRWAPPRSDGWMMSDNLAIVG